MLLHLPGSPAHDLFCAGTFLSGEVAVLCVTHVRGAPLCCGTLLQWLPGVGCIPVTAGQGPEN